MHTDLIIIDNFYDNVDDVREFALNQEFSVSGNYPGNRTVSFLNESIKQVIGDILMPHSGIVTNWHTSPDRGGYTGAFQITTAHDRSWIHHDRVTNWAGVCYLTPNAPLSSGTGLYQHKATGLRRAPKDPELEKKLSIDGCDLTKWERTDTVANVYNRLVLYRADLYHSSLDYFGTDLITGRLFQTFFISTER